MYKYYNVNPNGYHIPDCVPRAITTATNLGYYEVIKLLKNNADIYDCDELCVCCYEKLLDYDFNFPHYTSKDKTAKEVALDFKNDIVILRMDGHLSVSLYGIIHDIWDCSEEIITDFWVVY